MPSSKKAKENRLMKAIAAFESDREWIYPHRINGELHPRLRRRLDSIIKQAAALSEADS